MHHAFSVGDVIGLDERRRLFRRGPEGLEPVTLWLGVEGLPKKKRPTADTFQDANARVPACGPAALPPDAGGGRAPIVSANPGRGCCVFADVLADAGPPVEDVAGITARCLECSATGRPGYGRRRRTSTCCGPAARRSGAGVPDAGCGRRSPPDPDPRACPIAPEMGRRRCGPAVPFGGYTDAEWQRAITLLRRDVRVSRGSDPCRSASAGPLPARCRPGSRERWGSSWRCSTRHPPWHAGNRSW